MKWTLFATLIFANFSFAKSPYSSIHQLFHHKRVLNEKAGGMDGGGTGSHRPEEGAAWFYRLKSPNPDFIKACVLRGDGFKADLETIHRVIYRSFKTWGDYIDKSDLYEDDELEGQKILTKIKIEGSCSEETELRFYFGTRDERVNKIVSSMYEPKGAAYRDYDDINSEAGTSKGFIWIFDPENTEKGGDDFIYDWSVESSLQAIVNHEVGHIMGVGHIENTIMQRDLHWLLMRSRQTPSPDQEDWYRESIKEAKKYVWKIDHESSLITSFSPGVLEGKVGFAGSEEEKAVFKYFTGRDPVGEVKAQIDTSKFMEVIGQFDYFLEDSVGRFEFKESKFVPFSVGVNLNYGNEVFKRVRPICDDNNICSFSTATHSSRGTNMMGRIALKNGKAFFGSLSVGQDMEIYLKDGWTDPEGKMFESSSSAFAIHFLDNEGKYRKMFVDSIYRQQ